VALNKTIIQIGTIRKAVEDGVANIQLTFDCMPPHDMNHEMLTIIKKHFSTDNMNDGLYPTGVAIFYFGAWAEVEGEFESKYIPPLMAGMLCNNILEELKKIQMVADVINSFETERKMVKS